eukprot:s6759_g2.t1
MQTRWLGFAHWLVPRPSEHAKPPPALFLAALGTPFMARELEVLPAERVADTASANALLELGLETAEPNLLSCRPEDFGLRGQLRRRGMGAGASSAEQATPRIRSSTGHSMQLAWLLGGFAEPPPAMWLNTRRSGVKPFSSLAHPSWVAGNLAYLKDLDFLETRMANLGKEPPAEEADPEAAAASTWKPPRKPKAKASANA